MEKKILIVDDEKNILKSLQRLLMETDYKIYLVESGEQALQVLDEETIDLMITDMKMPMMNGYELLKKVREKHPRVLRLILSGYAEKELIFKSIQENLALFYLLKPWDNQKLLNTIDRLFQLKELLREKNMNLLIEQGEKYLITKDSVYKKINQQIMEKADMKQIAEMIEQDPLLSAKLLRFVSAAFDQKIGSVQKALRYLSLNDLKSIFLTDELYKAIQCKNVDDDEKDIMLRHAKLTNRIVHRMYKEILQKEITEQFRTAGLLANIGMLVMIYLFQDKYSKLLNQAKHQLTEMIVLEEEHFGINHQDIGGYLLGWWGLPYPLVEAAFFHHNPDDQRVINKELLYVVNIATFYAWKIMGISVHIHHQPSFALLGIRQDELEPLIEEIKEEYKDFIHLDLEGDI